MMKMTRIALIAASLAVCSFTAQAANVEAAPSPSQDPLVQHLKLSNEQINKIKELHQQLEQNVSKIPMTGVKDGALIDMFQAGKWDESTVKSQLSAFSKIEQQARYYRVKYYFDVSQVLTPEQRKKVKTDMANALAE
ncbi:Spy/CpxP family protein refolding chaperone [Enterobacter kobei]|uniref:Spy/CpxP family protein refolding chaperone n=1 Tax=Enterobacter kobei TaxID=208224 RepID=UPI00063AE92D|nr:Spy/CpxP family protein refolding chaperone [Enterobacter kobei]KLG25205.1 VirG [Enterobacter kobei]MCK6814557.1 Spy/CpxP family protein refolding chaperone [Enterobacter kobei]MCK6917932.1 Spy/CpxP family protein refolding chaperone [Enterobacter kobei]MCK7084003.1 Spy/CpxP family protein refolding chaperone [Enterobacter kobei]MCK7192435.1 Spy/CpxP family protein refolding chaperone [Enterobacter kobei]